jgi:hypothetical protein
MTDPSPVEDDIEDAPSVKLSRPPKVENVPWFHQLRVSVKKNMLLLSRRPVQLALMCLSSVGSVLLAYSSSTTNEFEINFGTVPLTRCGTVDQTYLDDLQMEGGYNEVPTSYNMHWDQGFPVTVMGTNATLFILLDAFSVKFLTNDLSLQHLVLCFTVSWSLLSYKSMFRIRC